MIAAARLVRAFARNTGAVPMLDDFMRDSRRGQQVATKPGQLSGFKFYLETYGCQMNEADSQLVLNQMRMRHEEVSKPEQADILLINTCAIRQGAQNRVLQRIRTFRKEKKVAILGCMGQRMKGQLQQQGVSLVVGPDSYRRISELVEQTVRGKNRGFHSQTLLSEEQTYADMEQAPLDPNSVQSFVPIMRGCNNMCSFCIVPFTRGRERSRDIASIRQHVARDVQRGVREITLLGQNVNSYFVEGGLSQHENSQGFGEMYRLRGGKGHRFADLLQSLAIQFPEIRFRFTSPHPKDFPVRLLQKIASYPNIVKNIHIPAQSGNSAVLARMRRFHTRQAYLSLVQKMRQMVPGLTFSSDFICGFCGQTEQEFEDTLSLVQQVKYEQAYMFAYSMRPRTHAYRNYQDSVPEQVKQHRLKRLIAKFNDMQAGLNSCEVGRTHLVLVLEQSLKDPNRWKALTLTNKKAFISKVTPQGLPIKVGDQVLLKIQETAPRALYGQVLGHSSIREFSEKAGTLPYLNN